MPFNQNFLQMGANLLNPQQGPAVPTDDQMMQAAMRRQNPMQTAQSAGKPRNTPGVPDQPAGPRPLSLLDLMGPSALGPAGQVSNPWLYLNGQGTGGGGFGPGNSGQ